ncbi:MAG: DUF4130 domain-containing protein [Peptococcaceae bacterium]
MQEILYSSYAASVFKACLLAKIDGHALLKSKTEVTFSLFDTAQIDIDKVSSRDLYHKYCSYYGKINWLFSGEFSRFKKIINLVFRHKNAEKLRLIENVLQESLQYGLQFVLANASEDSRKLFTYYSSVAADIHANKGLCRLQPLKENTLLGQIKTEHNTGDKILYFFTQRFPGNKIVLVDKNKDLAFIYDLKQVYITNGQNYQNLYQNIQSRDLYTDYWYLYYETQYIPERKNPKLALKNLPQKRWNDSFEIEFLKKHLDK